MILKIELENQEFLDIDFESAAYITGPNQKQIWKVFRSLYYYFNKNPKLTENIYGENDIELVFDGNNLSVKNNDVFFINNRDSIYDQMAYKKNSLLFELLNGLEEDMNVAHSIENINNENLKLEMVVQNLLSKYSNNLKAEFQDMSYLDLLKNYLLVGYEANNISYPLEFMDTENLLDEFLKFIEFKLKNNGKTTWLILYNLDSFIAPKDKLLFITRVKELIEEYDLKLIYLGNDLSNVPIDKNDLDKIIISANSFHQLLPFDEFLRSIRMHYPNNLDISDDEFVAAIKRISAYIGNDRNLFISNKDLVLLKVVNDILGYGTSFDLKNQLLTNAETEFLKD